MRFEMDHYIDNNRITFGDNTLTFVHLIALPLYQKNMFNIKHNVS